MQVCFAQSQREPVNSVAHARDYLTAGEKCAFLAGSWDECPGDLRNFWVEQLIAAQICANPGLNNLLLGGLAGRIAQS